MRRSGEGGPGCRQAGLECIQQRGQFRAVQRRAVQYFLIVFVVRCMYVCRVCLVLVGMFFLAYTRYVCCVGLVCVM